MVRQKTESKRTEDDAVADDKGKDEYGFHCKKDSKILKDKGDDVLNCYEFGADTPENTDNIAFYDKCNINIEYTMKYFTAHVDNIAGFD